MTNIPDYSKATNAAYQTLIRFREFDFPISVIRILRQLRNVRLFTYHQLAERFGNDFYQLVPTFGSFVSSSSDYGFSVCHLPTKKYIVAYNSDKDETTIRFTLAHELGHVILEHTQDGDKENREANCFARNFLCPIPVVKELSLKTEYDYIEVFNVSEPMAHCAIGHSNSDYYYITRENYNHYNDSVYFNYTNSTPYDIYGYRIAY